jgi:hypothetical protein
MSKKNNNNKTRAEKKGGRGGGELKGVKTKPKKGEKV